MARGNRIVITSPPSGIHSEGLVKTGQTFFPGMVVVRDPTIALVNGRHTYKIFNETADGDHPTGGFWVVTEGLLGLIGKTTSDSYAAGERCSLYSPKTGEELNLLVLNLAGTADDHAIGEKMMLDTGTSKLIVTTGTPELEIAQLLEAIVDPTADTLAWCQWGGNA
jgi:hypothetical protein